MKEIIHEYGGGIIAALATALVITLFSSLVFSGDGIVSKNIETFVSGFAGKSREAKVGDILSGIDKSRIRLPEARMIKTAYSGRNYDIDELFDVPKGYAIRASRVKQLDDLSLKETSVGRANMAISSYENTCMDVTGDVLKNGGRRLYFFSPGYYELWTAMDDGTGRSVRKTYMVCVRA